MAKQQYLKGTALYDKFLSVSDGLETAISNYNYSE